MMYFLLIITIFIFGFGICLQSIMFPQINFSLKHFFKIIKISFWTLLANFFLLDTLNSELDCTENCSNSAAVLISYLILMILAFLLPVLMINLLIATLRYKYIEN